MFYEPTLDRSQRRRALTRAPGGAAVDWLIILAGLMLALLSDGMRAPWAAPAALALGGLVTAFRLAPLAALVGRLFTHSRGKTDV